MLAGWLAGWLAKVKPAQSTSVEKQKGSFTEPYSVQRNRC
jgi:hypothetical protein